MNIVQDSEIMDYKGRDNLLSERVVLITGAGAGIGRAVAIACAAQGATVILLGRKVPRLEEVYDEIVNAGSPRPSIVPMDLEKAQGEHYQALVDALESEHGRLDGLVHNAGILGERSPIGHFDVGTWQRVMHVNLTAPFILTRCLLPLLQTAKDPSIVFTSSGVGRRGKAFWGAYAVSKFGTEGLMQVLADELEGTRPPVRVNCINPGPVRTELRYRAYPAEDRDKLRKPDEIVGPYLYLLGPDSEAITGQSLDCQPPASAPDTSKRTH